MYGGEPKFCCLSYHWFHCMSVESGKHIHRTMCVLGGKDGIKDGKGPEVCQIDRYEPT